MDEITADDEQFRTQRPVVYCLQDDFENQFKWTLYWWKGRMLFENLQADDFMDANQKSKLWYQTNHLAESTV